ncbi:MAG: histidine ammonia-lyase [Bacteroidales bacterium]|jgi:histidine ammonia-lyase|nr:histidine ammonia-lyase [Bacteroidales bacterium]
MGHFIITLGEITLQDISTVLNENRTLKLSDEVCTKITKCRDYLDRKTSECDKPIYGVTTGFGSLCNVSVSQEDLSRLQKNLMMSHACGTGEYVPLEVIKIMLLLKIKSLSLGYSGVQLKTVERLIDFFNNGVLPVVYQLGSLGASGDLAPLAHLSLPLIGLGDVWFNGEIRKADEVLAHFKWNAIELQSKEGLALLNGTQFMGAYSVYNTVRAKRLYDWANITGALSLEAFDGLIEPFNPLVHEVRHQKGQMETAQKIKSLLEGSTVTMATKHHVQDPYSFRCMPQVHGASKDAIDYTTEIVLREINSATDNPTIFPDEDLIISAGNFHGQPLALAQDFLAIAVAELGNISERRTYQLIGGKRGLPPFLVKNPGLNSGFMIPQYVAASIVSQNKQLCTPASIDSIESSQGQEDHVSMGANAATKAFRVIDNTERILAIELMNAAQAFEFRRPLTTSPFLENIFSTYRKCVPFVENDELMYPLIAKSVDFLRTPSYLQVS